MPVNNTRSRLGGARMATRRRLGPLVEMAEQGGAEGVGGGDGEWPQVTAERLRAAGLDVPDQGARRFWTRKRVNEWVCSVSSPDPRLFPAMTPRPSPDLRLGSEPDHSPSNTNCLAIVPRVGLDPPSRIRKPKRRRVKRHKITISDLSTSFRRLSSEDSDDDSYYKPKVERVLTEKERMVKEVTNIVMNALPLPKVGYGPDPELRIRYPKKPGNRNDNLKAAHKLYCEAKRTEEEHHSSIPGNLHDTSYLRASSEKLRKVESHAWNDRGDKCVLSTENGQHRHHHSHHRKRRHDKKDNEMALPTLPHTPVEVIEKRRKLRIRLEAIATAKGYQIPVIPGASTRSPFEKPEMNYVSRAHNFPLIKSPPYSEKYGNEKTGIKDLNNIPSCNVGLENDLSLVN